MRGTSANACSVCITMGSARNAAGIVWAGRLGPAAIARAP